MTVLLEEELSRDGQGHYLHSQLPKGVDEIDLEVWLEENGYESQCVLLQDDTDTEAFETYYDVGETDLSDWMPDKPDGDEDWCLVAIQDSDSDGPYALFAKPAARA